jgi:PKD repeat protein
MKERMLKLFLRQSTLAALVFCGLLAAGSARGEIISADRRITWQGNVGVPGGIPNRTTIFCNVKQSIPGSTLVAVGNGVADDTAALQAALNLCPSNQVVYIPAGTYRVTSTLTAKSFTTVRGAGPGVTKLQFYNTDEKIKFGAGSRSYNDSSTGYFNVSGSPARGATTIAMSGKNSDIAVGNILIIDQLNDGTQPLGTNLVTKYAGGQTCNHCSRDSGNRALMQTVEITAVNGTNITFQPGLFWPRSSALDPEAFSIGLNGQWIGCEDLMVSAMTQSGGHLDGTSFHLNGVKYCWVKNCESDYTNGDHVKMTGSFRCEARDSYFHDGYSHGPGQAEVGIMLGMSSGCLYENNIVRRGHAPVYINWGASGNVIGYNYIDDSYRTSTPNHVVGGIFWHGAHPMMNLIEGNVVSRIFQDNVWGSTSHETIFRNYVTGVETHWPPYDRRGAEQTNTVTWPNYGRHVVYLGWGTRNFNFVGNVLGHYNFRTNWSSTAGPGNGTPALAQFSIIAPTGYSAYQTPSWLWVAGYGSTSTHTETAAWTTTLRHGNWDVVTETTTWDSGISDHNIPNSLYLPGKPTWWGDTLPWPAIGPDVNPRAAINPALNRWRATQGGNQPPVVAATASPTSGATPLTVSFSSAGSSDPEGANLTYAWTFGDGGTSSAANPSRTYQSAGNYNATLTVSDGTNTASSTAIAIRAYVPGPPVAVASATPTSGGAPLTVAFSSAGSYDPEGATLTFNWTFGDGTTSTAANPSHAYAAGTFTAHLQVSDGTQTGSSSPLTITVTNPAPGISLTSPANGGSYAAPATINLAASVTPNGHAISKVQFYNGAALLGEDSIAPYTLAWTNVGAGSYLLKARVLYDASAITDSSVVIVGVGGLVAAYGFEEGIGGMTADSSGNGNNGVLNSTFWTSAGKFGRALSFNGTSSFVTVNNSPSLNLSAGLTLEAWVYPTATTAAWRPVIFKPYDSSQISYVLQGLTPTQTKVPSIYVLPSADNLFGPSPLPTNTWSHLAATYDGSSMRMYVNGTLVADKAQTGTINLSAGALTIGGNALYSAYWLGLLDEVRIYNRALSAAEIQSDMNNPVRLDKPAAPQNIRIGAE